MPAADDSSSQDLSGVMNSVIFTHNSLNEMTWRAIQRWESLHPDTVHSVKLNRFIGRPDDLSPIAYMRQFLGGPVPFDRHDWYLLRDGQEVRYVIDFYFDESKAGSPEVCTPACNNSTCGTTSRCVSDLRLLRCRLSQSLTGLHWTCLLYTSPSPRDRQKSRMPSSA